MNELFDAVEALNRERNTTAAKAAEPHEGKRADLAAERARTAFDRSAEGRRLERLAMERRAVVEMLQAAQRLKGEDHERALSGATRRARAALDAR